MYIFGINGAHLLITCFKVTEQNLDGVNNLRVILRLFCQIPVSYTHLRAHETKANPFCLEK